MRNANFFLADMKDASMEFSYNIHEFNLEAKKNAPVGPKIFFVRFNDLIHNPCDSELQIPGESMLTPPWLKSVTKKLKTLKIKSRLDRRFDIRTRFFVATIFYIFILQLTKSAIAQFFIRKITAFFIVFL